MKSFLRVVSAVALSIIMFNVSAQSNQSDKGWPVSKGVQYYSNKSLASFKPTKIKTQGAPSIVQSKGVHASKSEANETGNVRSAGYPTWIISKPVNLISK